MACTHCFPIGRFSNLDIHTVAIHLHLDCVSFIAITFCWDRDGIAPNQ